MDKFSEMQAFVAVFEASGFSAAARELGLSRSAVNRSVINLEARLGVQLFNRSTRAVSPTSEGLFLLERAKRILGDLDEAESALMTSRTEACGPLRINAPMTFGTRHMSTLVAEFMIQNPKVEVELTLEDRFVDPIVEGYDMVVRIAEPKIESTLAHHIIADIERIACASPSYLATWGAPNHPSELRKHQILHYGNLTSGEIWRFDGPDGPVQVQIQGVLCSNNIEPLRGAAVAGVGVAVLLNMVATDDLDSGALVPILPGYKLPPLRLQAIHPAARHPSAKVKLFIDLLKEKFAAPQ